MLASVGGLRPCPPRRVRTRNASPLHGKSQTQTARAAEKRSNGVRKRFSPKSRALLFSTPSRARAASPTRGEGAVLVEIVGRRRGRPRNGRETRADGLFRIAPPSSSQRSQGRFSLLFHLFPVALSPPARVCGRVPGSARRGARGAGGTDPRCSRAERGSSLGVGRGSQRALFSPFRFSRRMGLKFKHNKPKREAR